MLFFYFFNLIFFVFFDILEKSPKDLKILFLFLKKLENQEKIKNLEKIELTWKKMDKKRKRICP